MDYKQEYINFLRKWIKVERPLTVVFDVSNGPAGMIVKNLFDNTKINSILINDEIDPDFKSHGPNPLMPGATDQCRKAILENKADLGVMFDADADRAFFLDARGEMVPACFVVGILAQKFNPPYVADELVFQSLRMLKIVQEEDMLPTRIGAYFIKEKLRDNNASFGAEFSGHYYFKDFFNSDSGIFTAILFINSLSAMDISLADYILQFGEYISETIEIKIKSEQNMESIYNNVESMFKDRVEFVDKRDGVTLVFKDFWINVRSSNTEPIMRIISCGKKNMHEVKSEILKFFS
jgi:phosphomannomutase